MAKRELHSGLATWLDKKLAGNGLAQQALKDRMPRALFVQALSACVGIRETGGNNKGPLVELIQETIGSANREAWCMSFVQSGLAYVEFKLGVQSPIAVSEHCMTVWNSTPKLQRVLYSPLSGAICIWKHGAGPSGHTGIITSADENFMELVEGNTESGVAGGKVERDGGGVYFTHRSRRGTGNMKVVGFLKPF